MYLLRFQFIQVLAVFYSKTFLIIVIDAKRSQGGLCNSQSTGKVFTLPYSVWKHKSTCKWHPNHNLGLVSENLI